MTERSDAGDVKRLLTSSRLELNDPDFEKKVMLDVLRESVRNTRRRYTIGFIAAEVLAALVIVILHPTVSGMVSWLSKFSLLMRQIPDLFSENLYFILPLAIILMAKKIIDLRMRYS